MADIVYFQCIEESSKLKVRAISRGYGIDVKCRFPKDLQRADAIYCVPADDVSIGHIRNKMFYRIDSTNIRVVDTSKETVEIENDKLDTHIDECSLCMDDTSEVVVVSCCYYCICHKCAEMLIEVPKLCALCGDPVAVWNNLYEKY